MTKFVWFLATMIALFIALSIWGQRNGFGEEIGIASWYSTKESKGRMANRERFRDVDFVCASWAYSFNTWLRVVNCANNKSVEVVVKDRGPSQPKCSCLKKPQKIIDLSKVAFKRLAPLSEGLLKVSIVEVTK